MIGIHPILLLLLLFFLDLFEDVGVCVAPHCDDIPTVFVLFLFGFFLLLRIGAGSILDNKSKTRKKKDGSKESQSF